jgi:hypothetical protein
MSEVISIFALVSGIVAFPIIFQGYLDITLPALFLLSLILYLPILVGRAIPTIHTQNRKKRDAPVGQFGNLKGILMELKVTKLKTFVVWSLVAGVPVLLVTLDFVWPQLVDSIGHGRPNWNLVLTVGGIAFGTAVTTGIAVAMREGMTGWKEVILDTYEKNVLWWYDSSGFLEAIELRNPRLVVVEGTQARVAMTMRGLTSDLRFHSNSELNHFLLTLNIGHLS